MREFLKGLDLDQETIDTIMAEHGKHLTGLREQVDNYKQEVEEYKTQINELNAKLQAWSDYYNNFRPHRSLTNRQGLPISPCQFLKQSSLICTEP